MKYFIIADPHGFYTEMRSSLKKAGYNKKDLNHCLIVCGDLFDRGKEPVKMFRFVKSLQKENFIYVRGNHEDLMFDCAKQLWSGRYPDSHHWSNGTAETLLAFCGLDMRSYNDLYINANEPSDFLFIKKKVQPVLDFITERCVNYFELNNYIFVHGWIPTINDQPQKYYSKDIKCEYNPDWRNATMEQWSNSRWYNGMRCWKDGIVEPDKTIVCGHWHCSWGWSYIDQKRKEFPAKNRKDWEMSFEPYVKPGIIALDACTAYSGKINVITIDE